MRWCTDGSVACINSMGCDNQPLMFATVENFVVAYKVDTVVLAAWGPSGEQGKVPVATATPRVTAAWENVL